MPTTIMESNEGKEMQYGYMPMGFPPEFYQMAQQEFNNQMAAAQYQGMTINPNQPMANPYIPHSQPPAAAYSPPPKALGHSALSAPSRTSKGKRRSKNETEGRNYKCSQCDKTYLSYPALYTHMKTKHRSTSMQVQSSAGRGRGRPKKPNSQKEERINPVSPLFFESEARKGGPVSPLLGFEEAYNLLYTISQRYGGPQLHPLYFYLKSLVTEDDQKQSEKKDSDVAQKPDHNPTGPQAILPSILKAPEAVASSNPIEEKPEQKLEEPTPPAPHTEIENQAALPKPSAISEDEKKRKNGRKCDDILSEYLSQVAKKVNDSFYRSVMKFVFLFRECMNDYGNSIVKANIPTEKTPEEQPDYCLHNNIQFAPFMCNEFVGVYLQEIKSGIEFSDTIEMAQNLCGWLFENYYTDFHLEIFHNSP